MKQYYYYLKFLFFLYNFKREISNTRDVNTGVAYFDIQDIDVKKPDDKKTFGILIRYLFQRESGKDIVKKDGREQLVVANMYHVDYLSKVEFDKHSLEMLNKCKYTEADDELYHQPEQNVIFVDFTKKRKIS